jgi:hypothetical protein
MMLALAAERTTTISLGNCGAVEYGFPQAQEILGVRNWQTCKTLRCGRLQDSDGLGVAPGAFVSDQ